MICAAYGENSISHTTCKCHTTCKTWCQKFYQGDFSFQDESRFGRPQKIETHELQARYINSAQIEKELAEQLSVMQQVISVCLYTMERVQREGRWISHKLFEDNKNRRLHSLCFQSSGKKIFCIKSLQTMKSGFFIRNLNVENHGLTLINLRHRCQSPIYMPRRFCSVSGEIGKVCCITSCYNRVKRSRQIAINTNWPIWAIHSKKRAIYWPKTS